MQSFFSRGPVRLTLGAMAVSAATLFVAGCDTEQGRADKVVERAITDAQVPPEDPSAAPKSLETAAVDTKASAGMNAQAKQLLAEAEVRAATVHLPEIAAREVEIAGLVSDIEAITRRISANTTAIDSLAKLEPTDPQADLTKKVQEVQGTGGSPEWIKSDTGLLTNLAAQNADAGKLTDQINQLNQKIEQTSAARTKNLSDAEKLSRQSESEKGDQSVATYKQGSDLRKQAADQAVDIDQARGELARAQADLAVAQGQQKSLGDAVEAFNRQKTLLSTGWQAVQEQMDELRKQSKDLLGPDDVKSIEPSAIPAVGAKGYAAPVTLNEKAARLAALLANARSVRGDVEQEMNAAVTHFGDAAVKANEVRTSLAAKVNDVNTGSLPDAKAWTDIMGALSPSVFWLQQANAETTRAQLALARARTAGLIKSANTSLATAIAAAKLDMPKAMDDAKLDDDIKTGLADADASLTTADQLLEKAMNGTAPEEVITSAHVSRALTQYVWSQLKTAQDKKPEADKLVQSALAEKELAAGDGVRLTLLPGELGTPLAKKPVINPNADPRGGRRGGAPAPAPKAE